VGRTVGSSFAGGSTRMSHRAIEPSLPTTHLDLDQLGKPHGPCPARAVSRPRGRGTGQGVEDAGESEGRPVIGRIGRCPSRKGADFRRVSPKAMPLHRHTCRNVRRRSAPNRRQGVALLRAGPASTGRRSSATYAGCRSGSFGPARTASRRRSRTCKSSSFDRVPRSFWRSVERPRSIAAREHRGSTAWCVMCRRDVSRCSGKA
jgi:hypothetical protein